MKTYALAVNCTAAVVKVIAGLNAAQPGEMEAAASVQPPTMPVESIRGASFFPSTLTI